MGYGEVMQLASDKPDWLPLVDAWYELSQIGSGGISAKMVYQRSGQIGPNLKGLATRGILVRRAGPATRGGHRAYYTLHNPPDTARALRELGRLS